MARSESSPRSAQFLILASICIVVAALYLAREILIPLALAILLSFLLAPLANRMERWGWGRIPSALVAMALALVVLVGIGGLVAGQVVDLAQMLPQYKDNIRDRFDAIRGPVGSGIDRTLKTVGELREEIEADASGILAGDAPTTGIPVRLVNPPTNPLDIIRQALLPLVAPVVTAGITLVFVLFILIRRDDLRDRLIRLIGQTQINVTTQALDDAAHRVSRYLLMMSLLCGVHGTIVAVGLLLIGLPNAILWGLLSGLLRFIPFLGPWIAAALPITLALAVGETWQLPLMVIGFIVVLELFSNNVLEPWLYGASTGVSPVAVLVAAVFWTWLWGGLGLLMATPLTVCLVVLGKYVPQLQFFDILLGDSPPLEPKMRMYQRLLAMDQEESIELAEEYLEEMPLIDVYDRILIPALGLAEQDRHRGLLTEDRQVFIHRTLRQIIHELGERLADPDRLPARLKQTNGPPPAPLAGAGTIGVVCLPAVDQADEIVAAMFAQVLHVNGFKSRIGSITALASEMLDLVDPASDVVCVSALPPSAVTHARYLCKRLRQRYADVRLIIGLWSVSGDLKRAANRIGCGSTDKVVTTLSAALEQVGQMSQPIRLKNLQDVHV